MTPFVPEPAGNGNRVFEIRDPNNKDKAANGANVNVTGVVVNAVDTYDETHNGKSTGTIYVQDLGSTEPYSGISLFNPSWVPGNLRVGAGDALDLNGIYEESTTLPVAFAPGSALVQIANLTGTFRYEANVPPAVTIPVGDLTTFDVGSKWLNMIVTVENVTLQADASDGTSGRVSVNLLDGNGGKCTDPFPKPPTLVNALFDVGSLGLTKGTTLKSVTGLVVFFCNLQIAPRSAADIVQ